MSSSSTAQAASRLPPRCLADQGRGQEGRRHGRQHQLLQGHRGPHLGQAGHPGAPAKAVEEAVNPGESDYSANITSVLQVGPRLRLLDRLLPGGRSADPAAPPGRVQGQVPRRRRLGRPEARQDRGRRTRRGRLRHHDPDPPTAQGAESWIASYKKKFGADPGPYSTQSYDAVRVAAEAIRKAGSTDGDKVTASLEAIDGFQIFSGPLKFTADHTLSNGGFVILAVKDGQFVLRDSLK